MRNLLCGVVLCASCVIAEQAPPASEIVSKLTAADDARFAALQHYSSVRKYSLVNSRFGVKASVTVRMTYDAPGPKQFVEIDHSGPAPLRAKIFKRMMDTEQKASVGQDRQDTRFNANNYDFQFLESGMFEGRRCFILAVAPKTQNPLLFRGKVYVDAEDYAIAYMDGEPAQNPSFWLRKTVVTQKYHKVGPFWLPSLNASNSDVRMFGHSEVKIEYAEYHVNPGVAPSAGQ